VSRPDFICAACGGSRVQHAHFVDLNERAIDWSESFGEWCDGADPEKDGGVVKVAGIGNSWCKDCEIHVAIIDLTSGYGRAMADKLAARLAVHHVRPGWCTDETRCPCCGMRDLIDTDPEKYWRCVACGETFEVLKDASE